MLFSFVSTAVLVLSTATGVHAQVFALDCSRYSDICDNHSNGIFCHGIGTTLHYDPTSASRQGNGRRRRVAVGCGGENYCAGRRGIQCDEYPYASTYDGGLGCYPAGFPGAPNTLIQSGVTLCANGSENGCHGQALGQFYRAARLPNGGAFGIAYLNDRRGPLGERIRAEGRQACPGNVGDYRFRSEPATPSCPARQPQHPASPTTFLVQLLLAAYPRMRRQLQENHPTLPATPPVQYLTAWTESGMMIGLPYYAHSHNASLFAPGEMVFTHDADGNIIEDRIATVEGGCA